MIRLRNCATIVALCWVSMVACTEVDLFISKPPPEPPAEEPNHLAVIQGTYCAKDPESKTFPVKILFVLDDSGSMATSDPNFRRLAATQEVIDFLIAKSEGVFFAIERFQNSIPAVLTLDPTTNSAFTRDQAQLTGALNVANHSPIGGTPYLAVLDKAYITIRDDITADPTLASNTRYVVIFLSDGEPTMEPTAPPYPEIQDRVVTLKSLQSTPPAAGQVTLHTAYLCSAGTDPTNAVALLQKMAELGEGTFKNFENGEQLNFKDFDVSSLSRDFVSYSQLMVYNLNARLTADGLKADSDADGIPDADELKPPLPSDPNKPQISATDPTKYDTDGDGCGEMLEIKYQQSDPTVPGASTHCKCDLADRTIDTDGDFLLDCEEVLLKTNSKNPDSDLDAQKNTYPDYMLDGLELLWNTARLSWDATTDYDSDGLSAFEEIARHMDPKRMDQDQRVKYGYVYSITPQADNQYCNDFIVRNVRIVGTLATAQHAENENLIMLYFVQGPQDSPYLENQVMQVVVKATYDPNQEQSLVITVKPEDFKVIYQPPAPAPGP